MWEVDLEGYLDPLQVWHGGYVLKDAAVGGKPEVVNAASIYNLCYSFLEARSVKMNNSPAFERTLALLSEFWGFARHLACLRRLRAVSSPGSGSRRPDPRPEARAVSEKSGHCWFRDCEGVSLTRSIGACADRVHPAAPR